MYRSDDSLHSANQTVQLNVLPCGIACLEVAPDRLVSMKCYASETGKSGDTSQQSKCVLEIGSDAVQEDRWFTLVGATFKKTHMIDSVSGISLTPSNVEDRFIFQKM
eukprot:TRINITY_DN1007_c0_g1_i1.p2 TRINITY_DN1007_c0_g1~~TRINITY_DN1007_c0_g1_i1.p2  ORF type:complete len:107 (+),score=24.47 TRINITY_DN1007_c0_g1_i1:152-472(+)